MLSAGRAALFARCLQALRYIFGLASAFRNNVHGPASRLLLVDNVRPGGMIPPMILTLDAKRRLTLPASLVTAQPGDHFHEEAHHRLKSQPGSN
jgi:hypothetical protein